jgi:hypothetical protein
MIERAGHYRNLERSQRDLARRYGVSSSQINKDIQTINEWIAEHIGDQADAELETLKTSAVQHLIEQDKPDKAFYLMMNFYETLMETEAAAQRREADRQEHEHEHAISEAVDALRDARSMVDLESEVEAGDYTIPESLSDADE